MGKNPLVSVIVPTKNSSRTLERCLKSTENQTYKNIEIIVVDNNSMDNTKEIAKKFTERVFNIGPERTAQKNFGIKVADGKYLLFIDSDMELGKDVIKECIELAEKDESIGGIIIPERSAGDGFWVKVRDFEKSFYAGTEIESARFFRNDLALKVGGFDEDVIFFEESTLPQKIERLGYNVRARIKAEILHYEENLSLLKRLQKKYYYGKTAWKYVEKYKEYGSKQISPIERFGLFLKNKRFYSKPLLAFGLLTLKSLEYVSGGLGFLVGKVRK